MAKLPPRPQAPGSGDAWEQPQAPAAQPAGAQVPDRVPPAPPAPAAYAAPAYPPLPQQPYGQPQQYAPPAQQLPPPAPPTPQAPPAPPAPPAPQAQHPAPQQFPAATQFPAPAQFPAPTQFVAPAPAQFAAPAQFPAPAGAPQQQFYPAPVPEFPSAGLLSPAAPQAPQTPMQPQLQSAPPAFPAVPPAPGVDAYYQPSPAQQAAVEDDDEYDETVVISRGKFRTKWQIIDADGTSFPLTRTNVLGRKPTSGPDDAQFIALSDPERVLSRTHVLVEIDATGVWVTDLKSTNGTEIDRGGDDVLVCVPLSRYEIEANQRLSLGGRMITLRGPE